ncbi:MAG: hypothetical protein HXX15_17670 [Rhodopseudomonas sp.]|uniref:hypothetical protein n=1 Tax=Rhodopseudomonas sp. TaxID=1078 RepID=UPI00181C0F88|nr:hypothetical protein [Rhodopseudomonas sp.]NVN87910.1 hypothetical protein [Rhodopseudomonas sp.]
MADVAQWDEAFLTQREDDERSQALAQCSDADWEAAVDEVMRQTADVARGFANCPAAKCRRARRCAGDAEACLAQLQLSLSPQVAQQLIEEVYAELQQNRRAAAEEG